MADTLGTLAAVVLGACGVGLLLVVLDLADRRRPSKIAAVGAVVWLVAETAACWPLVTAIARKLAG